MRDHGFRPPPPQAADHRPRRSTSRARATDDAIGSMAAVGSFLLGIRVVLAAVFAVAGVAKLLDQPGTRRSLSDFGVPEPDPAGRGAAVAAGGAGDGGDPDPAGLCPLGGGRGDGAAPRLHRRDRATRSHAGRPPTATASARSTRPRRVAARSFATPCSRSSRRSSSWRAQARRYPTGSRPVPRPSWSRSRPGPPRSRWRCSPCACGRTGAISGATSLPHGRSSPPCRQDCRSAPRRPASPSPSWKARRARSSRSAPGAGR